jgi:hypothetical protein
MLCKTRLAAIVLTLPVLLAPRAYSQHSDDDGGGFNNRNGIRRVLLISIDGMHALDYLNCSSGGYCPNLVSLGKTGVNYTRTSTSRPSDSFPGLMALVTGGTPKTHGAFYDVAYDRVLAPPTTATGNGLAGGTCTTNKNNGTTTEYEEGVDIDQTQLSGGGPYTGFDGGIKSIDPNRLPRDPFNNCLPVYPWNFIRTNTIYGVIHAAGGHTAWSDKHAVYAAVSGPSNNASNVDDYYAPDVNSNVIALKGVTTADGLDCNTITVSGSWVDSFENIKCNDQLKVNAVLNQINGKTHLGGATKAPVPNIFGMNFQAVSVGQKLVIGTRKGGYTDAAGTPTTDMKKEIVYVDDAIGQMVDGLKDQNLLDTTLIIITAKHGQSPVDTNRFTEIHANSPAHLLAAMLPASESPLTPGGIGPTEDDISQLWLLPNASVTAAVNILEMNAAAAGVGQIFYGPSLQTMFNAGGLPPLDPRTPDIIVQPNVGVVYSGSSAKQAEHGGFAHDDTTVIMLVSNPSFQAKTVTSFVETMQVAPTILQALGLDPTSLDAVKKEGTPVLPGLSFKQSGDN